MQSKGTFTATPKHPATKMYEVVEANIHARFEVFTAVTMKNGVFWVVTQIGRAHV
jgi:hypothetical protein